MVPPLVNGPLQWPGDPSPGEIDRHTFADDALEREAEATADAISLGGSASPPEHLQESGVNSTLARSSDDRLLRGSAEPLDWGIRRVMEPRFGFDLGGVRVHRSVEQAAATTVLNARAFTVGRGIAFAPGEFRPDTASGQRLLVHELTHVRSRRALARLAFSGSRSPILSRG